MDEQNPHNAARQWIANHVALLSELDIDSVIQFVEVLDKARRRNASVYIMGNGGSAAAASHFALDLMKATALEGQPPVRAVALADNSAVITAFANDVSFADIFSAQLKVLAQPGDMVVAITGSGKSPNIVRGLNCARELGLDTVGLLGMGGGPARLLCDVVVHVDSNDYPTIEDIHVAICHLVTTSLRDIAVQNGSRRAVFLDRDGVVVAEHGPHPAVEMGALLPGAAEAIAKLNANGWVVVVVTNQPAVSRGVVAESYIEAQHAQLAQEIGAHGGEITRFYYCPHHPDGSVSEYRMTCDCRKPLPGMLLRAARELNLDLTASIMIGDRMTDLEAGVRAGCSMNLLVESGHHNAPRIVSEAPELGAEPTAQVADLAAAVEFILAKDESRTTAAV